MTQIRPSKFGEVTALFTVYGHSGANTLEFEDISKVDAYGALIDNVGVFGWNSNKSCFNH